mgnify:CR=1 FL=1
MTRPTLDHTAIAALTSRAAIASVGAALLLVSLKTWAHVQADSAALLSSLADSALDVVASLVTLISVRFAAVPPDADHRYGHGKAEALAGAPRRPNISRRFGYGGDGCFNCGHRCAG